MSDPGGLGMTYRDLLLAAARELGCEHTDENGDPIVPPMNTAREDLRLCQLCVTRSIRRLVSASPDWSWLRQRAEITLEVGEDTYDMPWWFGGMHLGPWTYTGSSDPTRIVEVITPTLMDQYTAAQGDTNAEPIYATFRQNSVPSAVITDNQPVRWSVVFWPTPSATRTVRIDARAYPSAMSGFEDRFFAGEELNRALETCLQYEAAMERRPERLEVRRAEMMQAVSEAKALDNASRPRLAGTLVNTISRRDDYAELMRSRQRDLPTYYNGTLVT